jgi:uncharacterized protein (TIGR01615 family)
MVRAVIRVPAMPDENQSSFRPASFGTAAHNTTSTTNNAAATTGKNMNKIPSLVFDMEDMHDLTEINNNSQPYHSTEGMTDVIHRLRSVQEPKSEIEYMLLLHVRIAHEEALKRGNTPLTIPELADTLRRLGYKVKLLTALGGGWGGACLRNLRHSFLIISVQAKDGSHPSFVVDPRFRDQFEIAHATERYENILASVDQQLVTTQDRLAKLVELLCAEMAKAFIEKGATLPPWRQYNAMLSKWEPRRSEEVDLTHVSDAMAAAAAALNNGAGLGSLPPTAAVNQMMMDNMINNNDNNNDSADVANNNNNMMMMMMSPSHQTRAPEGAPSPISEGAETLGGWSSETADSALLPGDDDADGGGGGGRVTRGSTTTGAALGTESGGEEEIGNNIAGLVPLLQQQQHQLQLQKHLHQQLQQQQQQQQHPLQHVYEDIRARAASLPNRRHNTWA